LHTRHTVDKGDMDTYFIMYRWSKTKVLLHRYIMK